MGGVGTFAVQIAKAFGAEVTAVGSTKKIDLVRAIGADQVIDYTQADFTQNGEQYDLIFDTVANHSISDLKQSLNTGGRYVACAFSLGVLFLGPWIAMTGNKKMMNMMSQPNQEDLTFMKALLQAGKVAPVIDRCYPLSETAEALRYLSEGRARGKVIISLAHNGRA